MGEEENSSDDFRIDPLIRSAVKHLLSQGKNYNEVATALNLNRHTVSKIDKLGKPGGGVGGDKQEQKKISTKEYEALLKRMEKLEVWRDKFIDEYNNLIKQYNKRGDIITNLNSHVAKHDEEIATFYPLPEEFGQLVNMVKDIDGKLRAVRNIEGEHWDYVHQMFLIGMKPKVSTYDGDRKEALDKYLGQKWGKTLTWEK